MNHRIHLIPCVLALIAAVALFSAAGGNPLAAGVGLAFLVCPIVMGVVMWLLMRQPGSSTAPDAPSAPSEAVVAQRDERR